MTFKEIMDFLEVKLGTILQASTARKVIYLIIMVSCSAFLLLNLMTSGCTLQDGQGHTSQTIVVPPDFITSGSMESSTSENVPGNPSNTAPDM